MAQFTLVFCTLIALCSSAYAVTVFEGLQAANAGLFGQWIQQDPALTALYNSSRVQTVFAPNDDAFRAYNQSGNLAKLRRLLVRQAVLTPAGEQHCSNNRDSLNGGISGNGAVFNTNYQSSGSGIMQPVIAHPQTSSNGTSSRKRQSVDLSANPIHLFSGLGNNVSVVQADTPYDGGLIQTLDGFFTLPQSFNDTFSHTNATSFSSGLSQTGLTSALGSSTGVTIFSTSNEIYEGSVTSNTTTASLNSTLSNHIIPNFLGYTPLLTNGKVLTTQSGNNLTVTVKNGEWYINNAKIIAADQITSNGVAHVVDSLIFTSTTPSVPEYTGAATSNKEQAGIAMSVACALLAWLL